jgi:hypothetical protein
MLDERYRQYRLVLSVDEQAMARSLARYGQVSPIVVCLREEAAVLLDGSKRLSAARRLRGFGTLLARRIEVDGRSAKAAAFTLNQMNRRPQEWEEALAGACAGARGWPERPTMHATAAMPNQNAKENRAVIAART